MFTTAFGQHRKSSALVALVLFVPLPCFAYVGPGLGLSTIGVIIAFFAAVIMAVIGFIWYPIRRLFRKPETPEDAGGEETGTAGKDE